MSDESELDDKRLSADLDAAGQRRLWLVKLLLDRCDGVNPEHAFQLAVRFEHFIRQASSDGTVANIHARSEASAVVVAAPQHAVPEVSSPAVTERSFSPPRSRVPLLDREMRERFISVALTGADNRALAEEFRLTVRQAHAVRLSLARQYPQLRAIAKSSIETKPRATMSREQELRLQEEFLQRRPLPNPTMEDVVRYVRQRGDAVVCQNGQYLLNGRDLLTAEALVQRANRYRQKHGDPLFEINVGASASSPFTVAPVERAPRTDGNRDGLDDIEKFISA